LKSDQYWDFYGFGQAGIWMWDGGGFYEDESVFGLGASGGFEWDWISINPKLPPVYWNIELEIGIMSFDYYNFSTLNIGIGAHYRF